MWPLIGDCVQFSVHAKESDAVENRMQQCC